MSAKIVADVNFAVQFCASQAQHNKAYAALLRILSEIIDPKVHNYTPQITWDDYDYSLELKRCPDSVNLGPADLQRIWDAGFSLLFVCYNKENTPQYHEKKFGGSAFTQSKDKWIAEEFFYGHSNHYWDFRQPLDEILRYEDLTSDFYYESLEGLPDELGLLAVDTEGSLPEGALDELRALGFRKLVLRAEDRSEVVYLI